MDPNIDIIELDEKVHNLQNEILQSRKSLVIVVIYESWDPPSNIMKQKVCEKVCSNQNYANKIKLILIEREKNITSLNTLYHKKFDDIPHVLLYQDQNLVDDFKCLNLNKLEIFFARTNE